MDDFQRLAEKFSRGNTLEAAAQVPAAAHDIVVSRFVVWFIDFAIDYMKRDQLRFLARRVQTLHRERATGGIPDKKSWSSIGADGQFGRSLWPADWRIKPDESAIVRCANAARQAITREVTEDYQKHHSRSPIVARLLASPVTAMGKLTGPGGFPLSVQRLFVRRLAFECVLYRTASSTNEAALQSEARRGFAGPYMDWLTEANDDGQVHLRNWLECEE